MSGLLPHEKKKVAKPMLWFGIVSMAMAFAGLTSGYIVSRSSLKAEGGWMEFSLPSAFTYSTLVIVLSSITIAWGLVQLKRGSQQKAVLGLFVTLLLGLVFAVMQYYGWRDLVDRNLFFVGSNTAVSWVYAISGMHLAHLIAGLITLLVTLINANNGKYNAGNTLGYELAAIFWHFLDILWVYLFLFLVFIR